MISNTFFRDNDNTIYIASDYEYGSYLYAYIYNGKQSSHMIESCIGKYMAALIEIGTNLQGEKIGQDLNTGKIVVLDFKLVDAPK